METKIENKNDSKNLFQTPNVQSVWKNFILSKESSLDKNELSGVTIFFVIKGTLNISINAIDNIVMYPQEMFIISDIFSYHIKTSESVHLMTCSFQIDSLFSEQLIINKLVPFLDKNFQESRYKLPINKIIVRYLLLLSEYIKDGIDSYYLYDLKRNELFLLMLNYYSKQDLAHFLSILLGENIQFKNFIMTHFRNVKNVPELATLANYSTSGFIKKFKKCYKESPYKWMQKHKASQILIEINQGRKSLQEIANEYNFSSYQHFATFCKIQFGLPPTEIFKKTVL